MFKFQLFRASLSSTNKLCCVPLQCLSLIAINRPSVFRAKSQMGFHTTPSLASKYLFRQLFEKESCTYTYLLADVSHPEKPALPNCYSRVITVSGDEHIIIFSKRDIKQWEELTYDYRFFSIDERLSCYCGFKRCRGVVNDIEAEEQAAKLCVRRSELVDWKGE